MVSKDNYPILSPNGRKIQVLNLAGRGPAKEKINGIQWPYFRLVIYLYIYRSIYYNLLWTQGRRFISLTLSYKECNQYLTIFAKLVAGNHQYYNYQHH
jgi:hypothetical protein